MYNIAILHNIITYIQEICIDLVVRFLLVLIYCFPFPFLSLTVERSKINSFVNKHGDGVHSKTYHGSHHHHAGNSQPGI